MEEKKGSVIAASDCNEILQREQKKLRAYKIFNQKTKGDYL